MIKDGIIIVFVDNMDDIVNFDFFEFYGGYFVYEVLRDDGMIWKKFMFYIEKFFIMVILMIWNICFIWFLVLVIECCCQVGDEILGNVFFVNIIKIVYVNGFGDVIVQNEYEVWSFEKEEIFFIR